MNKLLLTIIILLVLLPLFAFAQTAITPPTAGTTSTSSVEGPKLNIPIPTLPNLSKIIESGSATTGPAGPPKLTLPSPALPSLSKATITTNTAGEPQSIDIPWLAEYLMAIYKYALIIGSVFAALLLIIGGFFYMVSGLNKTWVEKSKKTILGSISGLIILLSAYLILYIINPKLTQLKSLSLAMVKKANVEDILYEKDSPDIDGKCAPPKNSVQEYCGIPTNKTKLSPSQVEPMLRNFAACGNFSYKILFGIANHESGFEPYQVNCSCFMGLFQFKKESMDGVLGANISDYASQLGLAAGPLVKNDARIFNVNLQTLAITKSLMNAKDKIFKKCTAEQIKKLTDSDMATLLYLYHNSGTGSLGNTLNNGGCNGGTAIEEGLKNSWASIFVSRYKESGKVYGQSYNNEKEAYAAGLSFGDGKANSVRKAGDNIIKIYEAKDLFTAEPGGVCPVTL